MLNKSFARRIGKSLSHNKRNLLSERLPQYLYSKSKIENSKYKKIFLEIGFGMGEHFLHQVKNNKDYLYIGVEVYLNGVAEVLDKSRDYSNFLLWADDIDLILKDIPEKTMYGIYILFPDPWPKNKQKKKRLLNEYRMNLFIQKLKPNSFIRFASDIDDYFDNVSNLFSKLGLKEMSYSNPEIKTKYHLKALSEGRVARFLTSSLPI